MSVLSLIHAAFQRGGITLPRQACDTVPYTAGQAGSHRNFACALLRQEAGGLPLIVPETGVSERVRQERRLLAKLGGALVDQAGCHLPEFLAEEADRWTQFSAPQQRALLRRLCRWVVRSHVGPRLRLTLPQLLEQTRKPYDDRALFPSCWGIEGAKPNCLGVLLLLLSFARRTGSRFRMVNLIEMNSTFLSGTTGDLYALAKQDIEARFLSWDGVLLEQMQERVERGKHPGLGVINFHHALALRCEDGSWFLLDPYAMTWGEIPAPWHMERLEAALTVSLLEHSPLFPAHQKPALAQTPSLGGAMRRPLPHRRAFCDQ